MSKAPNLGKPPKEYSPEYMNGLVNALTQYFRTVDNPGPIQATTANFSYYDGSAFVLGLVKTDTLDGALLGSDTTVILNSTTNFASSGTAYILDGANSDKIAYTGKTATDLTGVTGVVNAHLTGSLVVASARRGDVFADSLNENTLKIIP